MSIELNDDELNRLLKIGHDQGVMESRCFLAERLNDFDDAVALCQIEHARAIGGEALAWGVAFGLRWQRMAVLSAIEPTVEELGKVLAAHVDIAKMGQRRRGEPGRRLARRVLGAWTAWRKAWSDSA
jgi:hypothetical protein